MSCLLQPALEGEGSNSDALAAALVEIDLSDVDWRIGNYQILEEIGRGGMGVIYRARQRHSRRIVALKRILAYHADSRETLARFRREAEAAASLDHPNILPMYEVSEGDDGLPFFTMKFAPGGSLLDAKPGFRDDPRRCVALMAKITRAVQYAHSQGILHRDLKPGNILLDGRGEPLVSDFGLAKWLDTASDLTRTLTIFGTPGFIAPEQGHGAATSLRPTADVYSLGAILFDLLAGRPPFLGEHALAVIKQAEEKVAPKLRALVPSVDRDLETICARCLEREPAARYRSAHDLATDLELWLQGRPIIARPVSPPVRVWRWSKRNPKLAGSLVACLALGTAAIVWQTQSHRLEETVLEEALARHSVAVEPFLDLDTAKPDSKLSSALAATLEVALSKLGPARVTFVSPQTPSSEARTAVQGTRRVRDRKLRVSLRLVDTADGKVLYRRIVEADTSDQIATSIANLTGANVYAILSLADLSSVEWKENDPGWSDENVRELLIAGKAVMDRRTTIDIDRAIDLFKKAVKAEPRSALAHSYLAEAHYGRGFLTNDPRDVAAANTSARTAIDLNPTMSAAHKALSYALFQQGRFRESLEEAFAAYELADSDAGVLTSEVANNLRMLGDPVRAAMWYRITRTNRPGANESMVADCLADFADDENAAAAYRRVWTLFPERPEGWMGLCRLALLQQDFATARKISMENWTRYRDFTFSEEMAAQVEFFSRNYPEAEKLYTELAIKDPNGGGGFYGAVSYQSALGRLRLAEGNEKSGVAILEDELKKEFEALRSAPQHPEILYRMAGIESSLGKIELALEHLRSATQAGWIDYRSLQLDPRFDLISERREFKQIVARLEATTKSMQKTYAANGH